MRIILLGRRHLLFSITGVVLSACVGSGSTANTQQAAKQEQNPQTAAVGDTKPAAPAPTVAPTVAAKPTAPPPTPKPQPTATPAPMPIKLLNKGFGQGDTIEVAYAFLVENPNQRLAVESTAYQVAVYDQAGGILKADSGYVGLLLPGQTLGYAGNAYVAEKTRAAKIDVQIKPGAFKPAEPMPTFTTEGVTYRPDRFSPKVVGVVKSPYKQDAKNVQVSVITYDGAGNINGGGFTFLNFVPANGQSIAEVPVKTSAEPAKLEMYASVTTITAFG